MKGLRSQLRQLEAVANFGLVALSMDDFDRLLSAAVAKVTETLGTDMAAVLKRQPAADRLILCAAIGWKEGAVGQATFDSGRRSQAGYTMERDAPVLVEDLWNETRFTPQPFVLEQGAVSGMSVVIHGSDGPYGVLTTHNRHRRRFTDDEAHFLQSIANTIGTVVQRRGLEERSRKEAEFVHTLFESLPAMVCLIDQGGRLVRWNQELARSTNLAGGDHAIPTALDFFPPDDHARIGSVIEEIFNQESGTREGHIYSKDGRTIPCVFRWLVVTLDTGRHCLVVAMDVTAQRRAQAYLEGVLRAAPDGMIIVDARGRIVRVNLQAEHMFGYSASLMIDRPVEDLVPLSLRPRHVGERTRYMTNPQLRTMGVGRDLNGRRQDGSEFPVEISLSPMPTEDGMLIICAVRDITERKRLEDQLRHSQKMQVIGQLAGGVAHDFNNLLTVIQGNADLLLDDLDPEGPLGNSVSEIRKAGERGASLTRQLLTFSRQAVVAPRVLNLNTEIGETEKMLRRLIGEDVTLMTVLDPAVGHIRLDSGQLNQVLVNLAVNARDAMPQGGTLTIQTATVDSGRDPDTERHRWVVLSVADTGRGMDDAIITRIFEPFFSTKAPGRGTGLGLATVYGIVKEAGGQIEVQSEVGRGSRFDVYFPEDPAPATAAAAPGSGATPSGHETVLIVEDESALRALARRVLASHGYTVLEASDGAQAVEVARSVGIGAIDLLLTDIVLPHVGGEALAQRLRADNPRLKVLFMSGYANDEAVRHGVSDGRLAFLQKPFSMSELACKVRAVLDEE